MRYAMKNFKFCTQEALLELCKKRKGETKFGEKVQTVTATSDLATKLSETKAHYVLLGICESIGVKANHGIMGTHTAWNTALTSLVNTQNNTFNKGKKVLVLGHFDYTDMMLKANDLNPENKEDMKSLRAMVSSIDEDVSNLIYTIVKAGKTPIIIGGGHNNAYGNIKGSSLALNTPINSINLDAHADFRKLEGRHSGNGFSYAFEEGFLNRYFIFGLHENYLSKQTIKTINNLKNNVKYNTFEAIEVRGERNFDHELHRALEFINDEAYGIEIDLDAIIKIGSSAMTPSGFSSTQARKFLSFFAQSKQATYLHLCEAAPELHEGDANQIGKYLSYLITDFIRVHSSHRTSKSDTP